MISFRLRSLEDWSFARKLSALAGIAVVGLLGSAVVTATTGMRTGQLLERIETGHLPALLLTQDLGPRLREIGIALQNAAAAQDLDALSEVDTLRDEFTGLLDKQRSNEALPTGSIDQLKKDFLEFYTVARALGARMMNAQLNEELVREIEAMKERQTALEVSIQELADQSVQRAQ
jgi:hypothetical protein